MSIVAFLYTISVDDVRIKDEYKNDARSSFN